MLPKALFPLILLGVLHPLAAESLKQNLTKGDFLLVKKAEDLPSELVQNTGFWKSDKVYSDLSTKVGLHVEIDGVVEMNTKLKLANGNTSHIVGARGPKTVVRYTGQWQGDGGNSYPNITLLEGARFVITEKAHIDYVLQGSFYTRQLWAYGDGTGTLEVEEGFLADRTRGGKVEDAFGTIRLNGVHLVTHHSRNLPFNTRPDGRGAVYPNGHIVWEGQPGSVWTVATQAQTYPAQLDFHSDGTIDCQQNLVHNGQRRVTAPEMVGGIFQSTGAFRTCEDNVTITKIGPGLLALEGQQGYYPGARMVVNDGLVRMSTNPGNGYRYDAKAGPHLSLELKEKGKALLAAETVNLRKVDLKGNTILWTFDDTAIHASEGVFIGPEATFNAMGTIVGDLSIEGKTRMIAAKTLKVEGKLKASGPLSISVDHRFVRKPQTAIHVIHCKNIEGSFTNEGQTLRLLGDRAVGKLVKKDDGYWVEDIVVKSKKKKKKKS